MFLIHNLRNIKCLNCKIFNISKKILVHFEFYAGNMSQKLVWAAPKGWKSMPHHWRKKKKKNRDQKEQRSEHDPALSTAFVSRPFKIDWAKVENPDL